MKSSSTKGILFILLLFIIPSLMAQKTVNYDSPGYEYELAMELFQKEKYGNAQQQFKYVYENTPEKQQDIKSNSYFYMGVCAAYLYNDDAIFLLSDFIRRYPVHAFVPEANYFLGKFYFYKRQYKKAMEYYDLIDERQIKSDDLAEFYFKKGYCYFATNKLDEAKTNFERALKNEGPYQLRATYYLAHIAYASGQYQAALEQFQQLQGIDEYKELIPVYIAQIYFSQKRYDEVVKYLPPFMDKAQKKDKPEMERILGLSYYNLGKYEQAARHFTNYLDLSQEIAREDYFAIGYTLYELKDYETAITNLSKTTKEKDAMAQHSYYLIGDCYLKTKQSTFASQSFLEAYKLGINEDIKEDAYFNYAKAQYASSGNSFNMAIKALESYIEEYPNSTHSDEATTLLSSIYMSTKNYQAAISSLERIKNKTPELLTAYQRCTYFRALELINSNRNQEALTLLDKSLTYPMDKNLRMSAIYWKAEAQYRSEKYREAFYEFQNYHKIDIVTKNENFPVSFYSLGYAAMKLNNYSEAKRAFSTYLSFKENEQNFELNADATARLADAYYMEKDLRTAIRHYEKCESLSQKNADYAVYQQAKCYGYLKNDDKKLETLNKLTLYYPQSIYNDDANYEIATMYHAQNNYSMAVTAYSNFIRKYPKSPYIRQAHNKMAQAYLNMQNEEMAIKTFKYVFETYPGSNEAKDALVNLENIYTEQGNPSDFFDYIRTKNMTVSTAKQDSVSYKVGENKYMRGDCEAAIKSFDSYVLQFPNGLFAAKAYFYKAECEYGMHRFDEALSSYEQIINRFQTEYNETALRKSAGILFNKKEYRRALGHFHKLLETAPNDNAIRYAQAGIMHCNYALKQYKEALVAAQAVLRDNNADQDITNEARLIAGKSALETNNFATAKEHLHILASNNANEYAAEAAYLACLVEYKQGNYNECEKLITSMLSTNYSSGSEYWFASVFILYGDVYMAKGDTFQARHTYQSIVDNYEGTDLREIAQKKVEAIDALEQKNKEKAPSAPHEVEEVEEY